MSINAKKVPVASNRVAQPLLEDGVYPARTVQIIDFGLQEQRPYKGEPKPPAHEISITYELVDEFMVDKEGVELEDKPRWVSETFPLRNLEADLAKSTKRYRALDPNDTTDGDFSLLTNIPCNVSLSNNETGGKVYTNVTNVGAMRPRDAAKCPELQNDVRVFVLSDPDMEVFNAFPDWIKEKLKNNLNFKGSKLEELLEGGEEEKEKPAKPAKKKRAPAVVEPEEDEDDPPFEPDHDDDVPY